MPCIDALRQPLMGPTPRRRRMRLEKLLGPGERLEAGSSLHQHVGRFPGALAGPATRPILQLVWNYGRSERIRTSDPIVPNDVRYQAALHSDMAAKRSARVYTGEFAPASLAREIASIKIFRAGLKPQTASHRAMRRVASAICTGSRAKQIRKWPSPPGPKAPPGAEPTPASSMSLRASARESEKPSIEKKR